MAASSGSHPTIGPSRPRSCAQAAAGADGARHAAPRPGRRRVSSTPPGRSCASSRTSPSATTTSTSPPARPAASSSRTRPGVLTEATADIAFALILMATRRLGEGERFVRSAEPWSWNMFFHARYGASRERRSGSSASARSARAVARRGRAFGMEIVYAGRRARRPRRSRLSSGPARCPSRSCSRARTSSRFTARSPPETRAPDRRRGARPHEADARSSSTRPAGRSSTRRRSPRRCATG